MGILKNQVPSLRTVRQIVKNFDRMICDNSFQRDFVWNLDKQREYIKTVISGAASSAIILADLPSCLEASNQGRGTDYGRERLKAQTKKGYTESKIDGHQRTTTLYSFFNNEFTISGIFVDIDGISHAVDNQYYCDLERSLQDTFLYSHVVVTVIYGFTFQEIIKQFVDIQKGDHLTPAEIRWAAMTPYNTHIVKLRRHLFTPAYEKVDAIAKKINRKLDVEVFDQTMLQLMSSTQDTSTGQSNLDAWYAYGDGRSKLDYVPEYDESEIDNAWKIFNEVIKPILINNKVDYTSVAVRTYWATVTAAKYLYSNGYEISDYSETYSLIKSVNNKLFQDSKQDQAADTKMQDNPPDSNYYWYWCGVPHNKTHRSRKNQAFIKEFVGRLSGTTCVTQRKSLAA